MNIVLCINKINKSISMYMNVVTLDRSSVFGPSGVRALPLGVAAKRSVHYICDYFSSFSFFSPPHTFLLEGVIVGF
jgi:hypothetical protein